MQIPPYTYIEDEKCAHQLSQLAENICKSKWKGLGSKIWPIDQNKCRSTKISADWPTLMADGKKTWPMASCLGRWGEGMVNKPPSSLISKITSSWSTTKHKIDKLRDLEARRETETPRTQNEHEHVWSSSVQTMTSKSWERSKMGCLQESVG